MDPRKRLLDIESIAPTAPEALALMEEQRAEMAERYPPESLHPFDPNEVLPSGAFVVARCAGELVGCACLRDLGRKVGELKRMYVRRTHRRRGIARVLLAAIEDAARARSMRALRLEAGDRQPEALALYTSSGYEPVACWGEYAVDPHAKCYEKMIVDSHADPRESL